jgi:hypothetical protein
MSNKEFKEYQKHLGKLYYDFALTMDLSLVKEAEHILRVMKTKVLGMKQNTTIEIERKTGANASVKTLEQLSLSYRLLVLNHQESVVERLKMADAYEDIKVRYDEVLKHYNEMKLKQAQIESL